MPVQALTMEEIDKARQEVVARLVRQWITNETNRRNPRHLLNLPVDDDIPQQHRPLLDELDRKLKEVGGGDKPARLSVSYRAGL